MDSPSYEKAALLMNQLMWMGICGMDKTSKLVLSVRGVESTN